MYWEEGISTDRSVVPGGVVDLAFDIACRALPVDHAYPLLDALLRILPWLVEDDTVGVHPVHGAESGNGWTRPEAPSDLIYLSRRAKLVLRLPQGRLDAAYALSGHTLDLGGYPIQVGKYVTRPIHPIATVFARYVVTTGEQDEAGFIKACVEELRDIGIVPKKLLCGREMSIAIPGGALRTRSLMLADLAAAESTALQWHGLGPSRTLGCGLFVGHKDVQPVKREAD